MLDPRGLMSLLIGGLLAVGVSGCAGTASLWPQRWHDSSVSELPPLKNPLLQDAELPGQSISGLPSALDAADSATPTAATSSPTGVPQPTRSPHMGLAAAGISASGISQQTFMPGTAEFSGASGPGGIPDGDIAEVLQEMAALGALPAGERQQIETNLRQTDPLVWPFLLRYYRSLRLRREGAGADSVAAGTAGEPGRFPGGVAGGTGVNFDLPASAQPRDGAIQQVGYTAPIAAGVAGTNNAAWPQPRQLDLPGSARTTPGSASAAASPSLQGDAGVSLPGGSASAAATAAAATAQASAETSAQISSRRKARLGMPLNSGASDSEHRPDREDGQVVLAASTSAALPSSADRPATELSRADRDPDAWRAELATAIARLERRTSEDGDAYENEQLQASLRMLYMLAGRREDALRPIPGASQTSQDFWIKQVYGLDTLLDAQRNPNALKRATEGAQYLRDAARRAGETGALQVRNLSFCTKILSFGQIERFRSDDFRPGQLTLLYAELENFKSDPTPEGYRVSLRARYRILDEQGQIVDERELPAIEETCARPRRDFFISYRLQLPDRIYNGPHQLQLTVEDELNRKTASETIPFRLLEK